MIWKLTAVCCVSLLLMLPTLAQEHTSVVDLGWLRVLHSNMGWRVVRVADPVLGRSGFRSDDIIEELDDVRVKGVNALSMARVLNDIRFLAKAAVVSRAGARITLRPQSGKSALLANMSGKPRSKPRFLAEDRLYHIVLPDLSGHSREIPLLGKWTLLHIWNTGCDPYEVEALNEMAVPSLKSLAIIGVAMHDTKESVQQFSETRGKIMFTTLLGGEYDGDFANEIEYFAVRTDVLVRPDGSIAFVGSGPRSLAGAWEMFKANEPNAR